MPRPRGGDWLDGEIQSLAKADVDVVVSLLTADEVAELELQDEESGSAANADVVLSRSQSPIEACRSPLPKQAAPLT